MTVKEKKNVMALRQYYEYLIARFFYIKTGFINVDDKEFQRMIFTKKLYLKTFNYNIGFRQWLLKTQIICRNLQLESKTDRNFYNIAEKLKKDILEWEDNGIYPN